MPEPGPETVLRQAVIVMPMNANIEEKISLSSSRLPRLDRLTSGLLMFGRNPGKAREMETQIRTRQVRKEYICRVEGEFPM